MVVITELGVPLPDGSVLGDASQLAQVPAELLGVPELGLVGSVPLTEAEFLQPEDLLSSDRIIHIENAQNLHLTWSVGVYEFGEHPVFRIELEDPNPDPLWQFGVAIIAIFLAGKYLARLAKRVAASSSERKSRPNLDALLKLNAWIWSPKLRKQTTKLLADQQAHIDKLLTADKILTAKWIVLGTWVLWFWYVGKRPIVSVSKAIRGKA
jgi:hypothetical protein